MTNPHLDTEQLDKLLTISIGQLMIGKEYPSVGEIVEKIMPHINEATTRARVDEINDLLFNYGSLIVASPRAHLENRLAQLQPNTLKEGEE